MGCREMTFEMKLVTWLSLYFCAVEHSSASFRALRKACGPELKGNRSLLPRANVLLSAVKPTALYQWYLRRRLPNFLGVKRPASFSPIPIFKHPKGALQSNFSLWILTTAMLDFNAGTFG